MRLYGDELYHAQDKIKFMFFYFYVMLCYVMLCYVMLCYVMLCYVMLCYVMVGLIVVLFVAFLCSGFRSPLNPLLYHHSVFEYNYLFHCDVSQMS